MYYAIDDTTLHRLQLFITACPPGDPVAQGDLLQALKTAEADPIVTSLLWTRLDVVAECRQIIQGRSSRNPDGTWFVTSSPFSDSARERLAVELAGNVDEFQVGIREEVETDIRLTIIEGMRESVRSALTAMAADPNEADDFISSPCLEAEFSHLSSEVVTQGLDACVRHIATVVANELGA